ncbi:MAG: hypothetical protein NTW93_04880 [Phycisphaerae bacterium]|nr:hypothetical protein [Phycisphaerae bacterium]
MKSNLAIFEGYKIRRHYDENTETWFFSVVDIIQVLIQQPDFQAARNYWKVLKNRLNKEGSETVTKCNRLKLEAADGKKYLTDVANVETLLRLIETGGVKESVGGDREKSGGIGIATKTLRLFKI